MEKSQMARIVELDRLIREGFYPSIRRFSKHYEVTERTVRRDLDFLTNTLLAPLAFNPTRKGYYYTESWEFPKILTTCANRAQLLYQLVKSLKALSPADRQYVIDQSTQPPRPLSCQRPLSGVMAFTTGSLSIPFPPSEKSSASEKFSDLLAKLRELKPDERDLVLSIAKKIPTKIS